MRRYQLHVARTEDRLSDRDPLYIVVANAESDEDLQEWFAAEHPDMEYDMVEICCDECSHPVDDCGCELEQSA